MLAVHEGEQVVGGVELSVDSIEHRRVELSYYIVPDARGRGLATAAVLAAVDVAFGPLGMHRAWAVCDPANDASRRVLERAGFRYEGRLRDDMLVDGSWRDSLVYGLVATDRATTNTGLPRSSA